jgi:hypothetical protein
MTTLKTAIHTPAESPALPCKIFILGQLRSVAPTLFVRGFFSFGSRLLQLFIFLAIGLFMALGCSPSPTKFTSTLFGPQAPIINKRQLRLAFEKESNYTPLANCDVYVSLKGPSKLLSPPSGHGRTDEAGQLEIAIEPVGIYDKSALNNGDIVVEYPADITVSLTYNSIKYEWDIDHFESFARYQDPLYQGLNRDPDTTPILLTLTIP